MGLIRPGHSTSARDLCGGSGGARRATRARIFSGATLLAPGMLVIAALNGWAARLLAEAAPAVSLFAPLTLTIALALAAPSRPAGLAAVALGGAAAMILVPSGGAAWLALALVAGTAIASGPARALLVGLAAAELFAAVGLNHTKALLLPLEAQAAGHLLAAAGLPVHVDGNAIVLGDRITVVIAGCSGASGALFAGLGAAALLLWRGPGAGLSTCVLTALAAGIVSIAANLARLSVMAVDATLYAAAHGHAGAFATDLAASAGVVGAVLLAERAAR